MTSVIVCDSLCYSKRRVKIENKDNSSFKKYYKLYTLSYMLYITENVAFYKKKSEQAIPLVKNTQQKENNT